jgi:hypothetical protein
MKQFVNSSSQLGIVCKGRGYCYSRANPLNPMKLASIRSFLRLHITSPISSRCYFSFPNAQCSLKQSDLAHSMNDKLVVSAPDNRNSGKNDTWNMLFGYTVKSAAAFDASNLPARTKSRFFPSAERRLYVGDIIGHQLPRIILCSIQYAAGWPFLHPRYG